MTRAEVPVLIVGGSLVGLSTAAFLGHHGVTSLVLERHRGTAIHPRAALVSQRTIETYRALGLQDEVEEAAAREFVQNGAIVSVESLGGKELDWYFRFINEGVEAISPSPRVFVTQIGLEPVLLRAAERLGSTIEYAAEVVSTEQDADGVTAVVRPRDGGAERSVRARYVVAADGAHSPVRTRLGIGQLGHGSFSDSIITIYFKADVNKLVGERNLSVIYVFGRRLQGFFRFSIDLQAGFLVVNSTSEPDGSRSVSIGEDMSEPTCVRYVREALGDPDIDVEIENVQRWSASADRPPRLSRAAPGGRGRRDEAIDARPLRPRLRGRRGLERRGVARRGPRRRRRERHRRRDLSRRRRAHGRRRRRRGALRHRHGRRGAHPAGWFRRLAHECGRGRRASTRARRGARPLRVPARRPQAARRAHNRDTPFEGLSLEGGRPITWA